MDEINLMFVARTGRATEYAMELLRGTIDELQAGDPGGTAIDVPVAADVLLALLNEVQMERRRQRASRRVWGLKDDPTC